MYLSSFHIFAIFAGCMIYLFSQYLIYYFFKERSKFLVFSFTAIVFTSILTYSVLLSLDSLLKSSELRNLSTYKRADTVVVQGQIFNNGKTALKSCQLNIRIINLNIQKIDGSIFDAGKSFDPFKLKRPQNSYSHDFLIQSEICRKCSHSFRVEVPYPKHFTDYKLRYTLNCS